MWKSKPRRLPRSRRRMWQRVAILIEAAFLVAMVAIWLGLPCPPPELWQRICHTWQTLRASP